MADIRDYDDIYEYARDQEIENEAFVGDVLNEKKMERLNTLKYFCKELVKAEPHIKYDETLLDNWSRNGTVSLIFPTVIYIDDARVQTIMAGLFKMADDYVISSLGGDCITMTFGIHDMWSEFHYDYDKK